MCQLENQTVEEVGLAGYPGDGEEGSVWAQHKYAARSAQVLQLFDEAFGEDQNRLIGVLGCQSGYFGPTENMVRRTSGGRECRSSRTPPHGPDSK